MDAIMAITDETIVGGGTWRQIALPVGTRRVVVQYDRGQAPVKLRPCAEPPTADITAGLTLTPGSPPIELPLRNGEGLWAICLAAENPTLHVMGAVDAISVVLDASDIEFGAVEVKDADTDTRAKVGSGTAANALRVTLASDGAGVAALGAPADAAVTNPGAAASIIAALKGLLTTTASVGAGESHIGEVGGRTAMVSASFTRPADTTAYASGDLVANATAAGSVTPMVLTVGRGASGAAASGMIRRARLRKSGTSISNASFRLHLYRASPTPSNGDNGAWLTDKASDYVGAIDITADRVFTDGVSGNGTPNTGSEVNFTAQTYYGLLEARATYTPASAETFTLELEVIQN